MSEQLIYFLKEKFGKKIGQIDSLNHEDEQEILNQLKLADKNISDANLWGILWTILGSFWLILGITSLVYKSFDTYYIGHLIFGYVKLMLAFLYLYRGSEHKKKKVILETLLFVNSQKYESGEVEKSYCIK